MTTEDGLGPARGPAVGGDDATECTECQPNRATERRSVQRRTEYHQVSVSTVSSTRSVSSVSSVDSASSVLSVHSVARDTIPASLDGWRASLFKFTRALKFDLGLDGADMAELRPHVELWHREASAVLADLPFSEVWGEVLTGWSRARRPAFHDPVGAALATAREQGDVPPLPGLAGYDEPVVALAYRLLFWLALDEPRFFISCRALAERLGTEHTRAWRILRMFEADGVIVCLKRGKRPRASRYRWNGAAPSTVQA